MAEGVCLFHLVVVPKWLSVKVAPFNSYQLRVRTRDAISLVLSSSPGGVVYKVTLRGTECASWGLTPGCPRCPPQPSCWPHAFLSPEPSSVLLAPFSRDPRSRLRAARGALGGSTGSSGGWRWWVRVTSSRAWTFLDCLVAFPQHSGVEVT